MKPIRKLHILCALMALCLLLGACSGQVLSEEQTSGEESTTEIYVPDEQYPTAADLDRDADFSKLIISSVYAGSTGKNAPVAYSYVCFYNTGRVDLALQGLSIFVCGGDYVWHEYPLPFGATIPAGGYYLVQGQATESELSQPALQIDQADAIRPNMLLTTTDLR
ncbi:MAG: lamin tail domain-containing protein, partial [Clostridia bacterium]|nr:lamin tail domain-containing protein [Clostridia bacterium]